MDKHDPSIDYLKIDEIMLSREYDVVVEYCENLGCDYKDVIGVWFNATNVDGLLAGGYYFEKVIIDMSHDSLNFGSSNIPGKERMDLRAESSMPIPYKEFTSLCPIECLYKSFVGEGYVTSFKLKEVNYWSAKQTNLFKTEVTISMNKWIWA